MTTVTPDPSFVPTIRAVKMPISEISYAPSAKDEPATIGADGINLLSTSRFRNSMLGLIGQSHSIFKLFPPEDVFARYKEVNGAKMVNVNFEEETGRAISLTSEAKSIISFDQLRDDVIGAAPVSYHDGVVRVMMEPFRNDVMMVNNDAHLPRLSLQVPLDGYGGVQSFLAMLRQICSNGMVAVGQAFKYSVAIGDGDNPIATIRRFAKSFYDEDGYSDLRARLEAAGKTSASVAEFSRLLKLTVGTPNFSVGLLNRIEEAVADTQTYYGLSALNAIDEKRARLTPSMMTVYDLINMTTELSTHITDQPYVATRLQGLVGDLLSNQFDLEGMGQHFDRKADEPFTPTFFVDPDTISGVNRSGFGTSRSGIAMAS